MILLEIIRALRKIKSIYKMVMCKCSSQFHWKQKSHTQKVRIYNVPRKERAHNNCSVYSRWSANSGNKGITDGLIK